MAITTFAAVSGDGVGTLATGEAINLVVAEVTTLSAKSEVVDVSDPMKLLHQGYFALGFIGFGDLAHHDLNYFAEAHWIENERFVFYPWSAHGGSSYYANRIRWHILPGGVVNLYVYGGTS